MLAEETVKAKAQWQEDPSISEELRRSPRGSSTETKGQLGVKGIVEFSRGQILQVATRICLSFITTVNRCDSYCGHHSHFAEVETDAQRGQKTIQNSTAIRGGAEIQIQALTNYVVTLKSFRAIRDLKKKSPPA